LKQMVANAVTELAAAQVSLTDATVPLAQREKRVRNAEENHIWTSQMLVDHLRTCAACRARESAMRPVAGR
jgi:hypothetical protein